MATRARELWLILRARNEATGALRSAARSMRGLQVPAIADRQAAISTALEKSARQRLQIAERQQNLEASGFRLSSQRLAAERALSEFHFQRRQPGGLGMTAADEARRLKELQNNLEATKTSFLANASAMSRAQMDADALAASEAKLVAEQEKLSATRGMGFLQQLRQAPIERWQQFGQTLRSVGRSLAITGGVALGIMGLMTKQAADMATEATTAATQIANVNIGGAAGAQNVARLAGRAQQEILNQMRQFPASGKDMTDTLYNIYSSMNVTFGQGTRLLRLFNQAWVAGGMRGNLEDVSNALITLGNNWKINANDMGAWRNLVASTMATVRFGRLDIEKYTQTMNQLAPAFHGAHQSIFQMNAAIAFLTRQLPSSRMSATGLARLMETLARMATPLKQNFGVAITDATGNLLPLSQIVGILIKQFPKLQTSGTFLTNFFKMVSGTQSTVQARRALQGLILGYGQYQNIIKNLRKDVDEFERSQRALMAAPGIRFQIFLNRLRVIEIEIGAALIPVFDKLGKVVNIIIGLWNRLGARTQHVIAQFAGWTAVGTIVIGALTGIAGVLIGGITVWRRFGTELRAARSAMRLVEAEEVVLAAETGAIAPELIAVGVALTFGIPLLTKYHNRILNISNVLGPLKNLLLNSFPVKALVRLVNLSADVGKLIKSLIDFWHALRDSKKNLNDAGQHFGAFGRIIRIIKAAIDGLVKAWHTLSNLGPVNLVLKVTGLGDIPGAKEGKGILGDILGVSRDPFGSMFRGAEAGINAATDHFNKQTKKITDSSKNMTKQTRSDFDRMRSQAAQARSAQARESTKAGADPETGIFTNKQFLAAMQRIAKLNAAIETAPNMAKRLQAIMKYNAAITAAAGHETKAQKAAQDQILQAMEQTASVSDTKASQIFYKLRALQAQFRIAPTMGLATSIQKLQDQFDKLSPAQQSFFNQLSQNLGDAKVVSDRTVLTMARNVDRLRKAFEAAPSIATYQAWYQANKRFTTLATQDQQQFAQDTIQANQAAVEKIKQNFQTALDFVRGLYNQFLQEMQQAFGQIGQGPFEKSLEAQAQRIRDNGSKAAQALRDQAQKIQDAAQNAQDKISATQGNLIDWGLLPKVDKAAVDKRVKELNDAADKLEKAANARADRLQKRLEQHKLTPKELLSDLQSQLGAFNAWNRHLNQLARRGAPRELVNQLRQLGPEYDNMLKGLLRMTPAQWRRYIHLFNAGQRAQHQAAMQQLQQQLRTYRRYGRGIVQAISKGIQDESPVLRRALIQLVRETFPGLGGRGGARTVQRQVRQARRPTQRRLQTRVPRTTHHRTTVHHSTVNYHYHADRTHHMTPQAYFRKMHFQHRNQRRC